ncbi:F0F1 ATP synthase subunit A [Candidatus Saccharibacteria bacterium]|nr:F0F1 ATP synthase subunit A [Candidatus Saccharibacteria bacterium]
MLDSLQTVVFLATSNSEGPAIHITPAELFRIGEVSVSNSMFFGLISSALILTVLINVAKRMTIRPKRGFVQFVEIGTEFIINTIQNSLGSRKKAIQYAPLFVSAFFFVMFSNWLGLIPGAGEAFTYNGQPVIRPFTADLNATLAASTVMMVIVQYLAIRESGLKKHIRHYFAGSLLNPATYLLGVFEVFSELTKILSLALRLFLNVAIGETILVIFMYLGSYAAPITALPILLLELFVGALQAYIFTMLTIMYLSASIKHDHDAEELERHELAKKAAVQSA